MVWRRQSPHMSASHIHCHKELYLRNCGTTPFYILDEVEAALDDSNLRRLTSYLESLRDSTQLIMITHQRRTMEMSDVLFGVSMQSDGVTKVISQKLDHALKYAE